MQLYPTILTLHIVFAGIWLVNLISDSVLKDFITKNKGKVGEKKFIRLYLLFSNLFGMIGASGILLTGIIMVILHPHYEFFQMSANHWLTSKQILIVIQLFIIFIYVIPAAKNLRSLLGTDLESTEPVTESGYANLTRIFKLNIIINVIVLINFLFAITH